MAESQTRVGKIARLPAKIREEVNRRLHDGEPARTIIAWLHAQPEVLRVLDDHFGEEPISTQNMSEWKGGGYQDWLARRDRLDNLKLLSTYAYEMAKAGGSISEGAAAIAGGKILEMLETLDTENVATLTSALASLRSSEASTLNARTNQAKLAQKERELALAEARFRRQTAEMFLKWAASEDARSILGSTETKAVKMEKLVQLMFGDRPE